MKNKLTKIITIIVTAIAGFATIITTPTYATCDNICCSNASDDIKAASGCPGSASVGRIEDSIMGIINGILGLLAVVAIIVIVIGGIQYMTSTGDPGKTKKAKDTILYACIGLIIVALAAAIVNFVIGIIPDGSTTPTP